MQTTANFLIAVNQTNPRFTENRSSLQPLLTALRAHDIVSTSANLWAIFAAIDALPPGKKATYSQALYGLQNAIYFVPAMAPTLSMVNVANGIVVVGAHARGSQMAETLLALLALNTSPTGSNFLVALGALSVASHFRVTIRGWDGQATNKCAIHGNGDDAKSVIACALEFNLPNVGAAINGCLGTLGKNVAWLESAVNQCPIYNIQGLPSATPSLATHGAGWISAAMINNWILGHAIFPAPLVGQQALDARMVLV